VVLAVFKISLTNDHVVQERLRMSRRSSYGRLWTTMSLNKSLNNCVFFLTAELGSSRAGELPKQARLDRVTQELLMDLHAGVGGCVGVPVARSVQTAVLKLLRVEGEMRSTLRPEGHS
jgi:hypothetical protein